MKRILTWMRHSIQRRLFLYFAALVTPLLILLGAVAYSITAVSMVGTIDQYSTQVLRQAILHLEM